ncbi:zinc finger protein [Trypanosoma melophagium]|uniref:zinc finger protein n=1 Tax=Trypanosoma melophagium TaxID=715481 RepID=UPI00351A5316|nr:zinc finger protein [Trypanosoma melophagium]
MEETTELAKELSERLKEGSYDCPICTETVRLRDSLYACPVCYGVMHLTCIRSWVKAQIEEREKQNEVVTVSQCSMHEFRCPLCQLLNPTSSITECRCFCGKVKDPVPDPLLVPGSCGQMCEKRRKDCKCTHSCILMCHPGPCPPCVLTRKQVCFCGKTEKTVGCSSGIHGFECNEICGKLLDCGNHYCTAACHEGPCPICSVLVKETCFCGSTERKRRCGNDESFSCSKPCSKLLDCGNHHCLFNCHKGPCQPCLQTPERLLFCPCGKVRIDELIRTPRKSCLDPIPSCGQVCGAPLPCGHTCKAVCHDSAVCPPCMELVSEKCGCGSRVVKYRCFCSYIPPEEWEKVRAMAKIPIAKAELCYPPRCSKPCRMNLSCGKHSCKEVCCTNEDHTCYRICTKRLPCGEHSCGQLCHRGPCLPCSNASYERLYCRCRRTWVEPPVPCGTKPPTCSHPCVVPRPCGHPPNHPCHIEEECPDCVVSVEKKCDSHGRVMPYFLPCYRKTISCGKKCGKVLSCCGTVCEKVCHPGRCEHQCTNLFPQLE